MQVQSKEKRPQLDRRPGLSLASTHTQT